MGCATMPHGESVLERGIFFRSSCLLLFIVVIDAARLEHSRRDGGLHLCGPLDCQHFRPNFS